MGRGSSVPCQYSTVGSAHGMFEPLISRYEYGETAIGMLPLHGLRHGVPRIGHISESASVVITDRHRMVYRLGLLLEKTMSFFSFSCNAPITTVHFGACDKEVLLSGPQEVFQPSHLNKRLPSGVSARYATKGP